MAMPVPTHVQHAAGAYPVPGAMVQVVVHRDGGMAAMGTIRVTHATAGGGCTECCPGFGGQPPNRPPIKVIVDGHDKGSLHQGQTSSFMVIGGQHQVEAKVGGVGGFLSGIFGSNSFGSLAVVVQPGAVAEFLLHWVHDGGCASNTRWVPRMELVDHVMAGHEEDAYANCCDCGGGLGF